MGLRLSGEDEKMRLPAGKQTKGHDELTVRSALATGKRKLDEYFFDEEETDVLTVIQFYGFYVLVSILGIALGTFNVL